MVCHIKRKPQMIKLFIPILAVFLSGCVSLASMPPKVSEIAYAPMATVPTPDQGKIILAVYQFGDLTGQQKPNQTFGEMSKAITQGSSNLLIKALKDVGEGNWFRVVERESLQSILQERKLIRTTRQMTQGDKAHPLGPMLYAGAYLTGGIVGYDSNTKSAGAGARFLGIGGSTQYRHDTITVVLRLINVVTGEVELVVMTEKTILSVAFGADKFKYYDADTQLMEVEVGAAHNEPVTYAVRKTIEGAVVELVAAGEKKGLWKYKPEPEGFQAPAIEDDILPAGPVCDPPCAGEDGSATITEVEIEEVLEILIEADNEVRAEVKEEASQPAPVEEEVVEEKEPVKIEVPLTDAIVCESSTHHFGCTEVTNEETNTSTDTTSKSDR